MREYDESKGDNFDNPTTLMPTTLSKAEEELCAAGTKDHKQAETELDTNTRSVIAIMINKRLRHKILHQGTMLIAVNVWVDEKQQIIIANSYIKPKDENGELQNRKRVLRKQITIMEELTKNFTSRFIWGGDFNLTREDIKKTFELANYPEPWISSAMDSHRKNPGAVRREAIYSSPDYFISNEVRKEGLFEEEIKSVWAWRLSDHKPILAEVDLEDRLLGTTAVVKK